MNETTKTWLKRALTFAIMAAVLYFVVREARRMDWAQVGAALNGYGLQKIVLAALIILPAPLACACFDLVGRHATGHHLRVARTMLISFTGYFFSLNLGALVGGLAFRYRLYQPYGLRPLTISQIIGLSVFTNWTGYVLLAGLLLTFAPPDLPDGWGPGVTLLRVIGAGCLVVAVIYLGLCVRRGGREIDWRGTRFKLPNLPVAGVQVGLSAVNWLAVGGVLAWLMPEEIGFAEVMPIVMVSAIAGIWSHVPGGLGVTELVFVKLLAGQAAESEVLAAVLVYRALYYFVPFLVAVASYFYLEATAKRVEKHGAD